MAGVITLTAEKRNVFGKQLAKERKVGKLPVVVYGPKDPSANFFVDAMAFKKVYKQAGESSVITLEANGEKKDILIYDVFYDPKKGEPVHADFYVIEKGKSLRVRVPIEFTGSAPAVKLGGIVVKVMHELEIEAMPKDLPHSLLADLSFLVELDNHLAVGDIKMPEGVKIITPKEEIIASISVPKEEEEAPVMDISEIEVEKKGKKEEEEGEGEEKEGKKENLV